MKKAGIAIAAVVLLIGSGAYLASYYASQPEPGAPVASPAPVACAACGKVYITALGKQPARCYYCQQEAVWRAVRCAECGEVFPLVDFAGSAGRPAAKCPKCGSTRLQEVSPDGLEWH